MKKRRVIAAMTAVLCCISAFSVSSMALTSAAETESDYSLQTILEEPIYGIGISEEPKKTFYILGEELDLTGLRLNGSYRMGELISTIMNEDYQDLLNSNVPIKIDTSEFDNSKAGTYHIYALYGNAKDSFTVTVFNDSEELLKASYGDNTKLMGDVNGDGTFGIADVIMLQKWLLGVSNTRFVNWKAADFCEDDKLDIFDLCLMKRALISNETTQNTPPTTQQIGLNRTNEVIELLNDYELNDYDEIYRDSLSKMFERFNEDGYIYTFSGIDVDGNAITLRDDHPNAAIWLMPHADYEDTGIMYHVAYKGKYYQVYYYFNDPTYTTSDLWGYMEQRLNIKSIKVIDEKFGIVDKSTNDQSDVSAYFALDDTHYCKVKTYEPEDALMDFLQVLKYEKLDIADNTSTAPIIPMTAQPIGYKDMGAMIEAIKNSDVTAYPEEYQEDYHRLFNRFQNDGFIYQVTENEDIKVKADRGISLLPYANYEDIGVGYYVTFKDKNYHIMFYSADADVLAETDGIAAYLNKRMGRNSDKEITVNDRNISLLFHENGQCYANAFVDENHYFDVIGAVSEEELTEFLNAFEYEKLYIEDYAVNDPTTSVTAQPIKFNDINELINILSQYEAANYDDLKKYPEEYRDSYRQMYECFVEDRFIYQVQNDNSVGIKVDSQLTLFPSTKYEDIGVGYYLKYNDKTYHVMFYYTDEDIYTETNGIAEYLKQRMGRSSDKIVSINNRDISLLFPENGQCYANAFIDENHYFNVIGAVSEEELTEFLNAFAYEKNVF